ncbi:MAG: helix-turn-helix transcriptional regulator [Solirubrobacterales bacterium]|nr:helix-turn-helix transcriptional regulator [Solirubrobacterales bacterium]
MSAAANHKRLGRNIANARKAAGMTQEQLADAADMHFTAISRLERGLRAPRFDTLIAVAWALRVPPGDLLDGIRKP